MKNIILLLVLVFTVNLCSAQTIISIKNYSGVTLDIGGLYTYDIDTCDPDPASLFVFGPALAVPHGSGCWFEIPAGHEVSKIGGSEPSGPLYGWTTVFDPCSFECSGGGGFTFVWGIDTCNELTIYP